MTGNASDATACITAFFDTVCFVDGCVTMIDGNAVDCCVISFWQSNSECNPNIYADVCTAGDLSAVAIHFNSDTTSTQFKIRVSTDVCFTDCETLRTINTNCLTCDCWNYIRFNITDGRYVQLFATDACASVLVIDEIKVLKDPVDLLIHHGHKKIHRFRSDLPLSG